MEKLMRFFKDEEGATAVEYALMVALIAAFVAASVGLLGRAADTRFSTAAGIINGTP